MASTGYFGFARGFSQFWKKGRKSSNVVTPTIMAPTGQSECGGGLQLEYGEGKKRNGTAYVYRRRMGQGRSGICIDKGLPHENQRDPAACSSRSQGDVIIVVLKNEESVMIKAKELLEAKEHSEPSLSLAEYYVWKELFSLLSKNVPHGMQTILQGVIEQDRNWYEQELQELVEVVQQGHNKLKELPPIKIAESFSLYVKSPYGPEGIDGVSQDSVATLEWCYLDPVEHSEYFASPEHFLKSLRTVEEGREGRSRYHEDVISCATMTLPLTKEDLDPDAILTIADKYRIPESVHRTMLSGFRDLALNPKDPRVSRPMAMRMILIMSMLT